MTIAMYTNDTSKTSLNPYTIKVFAYLSNYSATNCSYTIQVTIIKDCQYNILSVSPQSID